MLALFRCLSCKYSFSTDLKNLAVMGAPGRVFTTGEVCSLACFFLSNSLLLLLTAKKVMLDKPWHVLGPAFMASG